MEQDILFTLSGVVCVSMPARVLVLFQETLRGGSDTSLRAAETQYRSTKEEETKDKGLAPKTIGSAHYWSAFVYVCLAIISFVLWRLNGGEGIVCQLCSAPFVREQMPISS